MTLLELLVGIVIGLLVIAVAMGAIMVSRGVSGTVSDASNIQQQGAYVLRVIGQQLRQAGSLYLNPKPAPDGDAASVLNPVAFEIKADALERTTGPAEDPVTITGNTFDQADTLTVGADTFTTGFRRYPDKVFVADNATASAVGTDYLARNCIGLPGNSSLDQRIESRFWLDDKNQLRCAGNNGDQPIIQNVAQFRVTYLTQAVAGGGTTIQYAQADDISTTDALAWRRIQGVEVCLVLYGNERIDLPAGSSYIDCDGQSVDITALTGDRKNRMHLLFRNTFQLRSQGLI